MIENNTIRYSVCSGVTLGKYGDEWDNRAGTAEGYNGTISRALDNGWSGENIGGHIVRDNIISHCEQAGIKIHAPIVCLIDRNYIHHCFKGIWLDWMTQGTRVTRNILHDNWWRDLDLEVNHGPYMVDHNILLSMGSGEGPISVERKFLTATFSEN